MELGLAEHTKLKLKILFTAQKVISDVPCSSLLLCLEPFKKFSVGGGWWVVVDSKFSVLLWSKALVLDLDQAEKFS